MVDYVEPDDANRIYVEVLYIYFFCSIFLIDTPSLIFFRWRSKDIPNRIKRSLTLTLLGMHRMTWFVYTFNISFRVTIFHSTLTASRLTSYVHIVCRKT